MQQDDNQKEIQQKVLEAEEIEDVVIEDCPVICIGHSAGYYFFISPVGQQRMYKYSEFTFNGVLSLFEGNIAWLEDNFPLESSGGRRGKKKKSVGGYSLEDVTQYLMSECRRAGLYNSDMTIRRVGVWRDESADATGYPSIIFHSGDKLWIDGEERRAGVKIGDALYEAAPRVTKLADKAAAKEHGTYLKDTLEMWNFARGELDVKLLIGFIGQAMLGAAPKWRVHCYITAPSGSGKSWLTDTIANVLGAAAHDIKNNFTEAGLRQSLTNEARCMMLDEAEHEEGGGRVKAVIELLRHMSGGKGSSGVRGNSTGQAQSFNVTGCAYLSSILHVPLKPQDKNRILSLNLLPFPKDTPPDQVRQLEHRMGQLKKLSPLYRRRMIEHWDRFQAGMEIYHPAFMAAGLNSRGADHLATLYAAADVLLEDAPATTDSVLADVSAAKKIIEGLKEQSVDSEGEQCLNHLYSAMVDAWKGGEKMTIGQLVAEKIADNEADINKHLGPHGLRFERMSEVNGEYFPARLIVANSGQGLEKIFTGTRWCHGVWAQAIGFLKDEHGQSYCTKPCRFAGSAVRGMTIPKAYWPELDNEIAMNTEVPLGQKG